MTPAIDSLEADRLASDTSSQSDDARAEQIVLEVWGRLIGRAQIDPEDEFFRAGGRADQVDEMLAEVAKNASVATLKREDFLILPYVSQMVLMILGAEPAKPTRPELTTLRISSGVACLPTFFYVPPVHQESTGFRRVGNLLGSDVTIHAIAPGSDVYEGRAHNTGDIAVREIVALIRSSLRPGEPFLLSGYCVGGLLAFQAARHLQDLDCRGIVLFDAPMPGHPYPFFSRRYVDSLRQYALDFQQATAEQRIHVSFSHLVKKKILWHALRVAKPFLRSVWNHKHMKALRRIAVRNDIAYFSSVRRLNVPVLFFDAVDEDNFYQRQAARNWHHFTTAEVTRVPLPGAHRDLFFRPNIPTIAEHIRRWISEQQDVPRDGRSKPI